MPRKDPQRAREYSQEYYRTRGRENRRRYRKSLRGRILEHYGAICSCCGEKNKEFLALDHTNGDGNKHRKEIRKRIYEWVVSRGYPDNFRILCHNCNQSMGTYGYCPHSL